MSRIVVTRALPQAALEPLDALGDVWVSDLDTTLSRPQLLEAVRGADAIICMLNDRIDREVLAAAGPQLAIVANTATGTDNLDVAAIVQAGAVATNTPGVLVDATADLAMALLLAVTRRMAEGDALVRSGTPWSWDVSFMLGRGLRGKRLGVIGMGAIGRATAERARAFGMEIVHTGRSASAAAGRLPLEELLETSDAVSLHCPLTPATRHLIDADALARMRSDAVLINTARGPVVDEAALIDAPESGGIAGAGLDVYEREPAVPDRLRALRSVVLLPHLGSATVETRRAMADLAVANVAAVLTGGRPLTPLVP